MSGAVSHPGGDEEHVPPRIRVVVNDRMQRAYVYQRTEPIGRNFAPACRCPDLS